MDERLLGTWKIHKEVNIDALLAASNITFFLRKMAQKFSYNLEFHNEGDTCKILMVNRFKQTKTIFKMNEEFDEEDYSGKHYRTTFFVEEGSLLSATRIPVDEEDPAFTLKMFINDEGELHFSKFFLKDGVLLAGSRIPVEDGDPVFANEFYINDEGELVFVSTITSTTPNIVGTRILRRI